MIPIAVQILQLCLSQSYICPPPDPPPMSYYQEGYSCYINGVFHESCPKPDYLTQRTITPYNRDPYTKIK